MSGKSLRLGCHLSAAKGYLAMGEAAVSIGADTFQFFTRNPRGGSARAENAEDATALSAYAQAHALSGMVAHAPYTLNLCSAREEIRDYSLRTMADDLRRLQPVPCRLYNLHPGSHTGQGMKTGICQITEGLEQLLPQAGRVTILLESMAGKGSEVGGSLEALAQILRSLGNPPQLGVCLDTCHLWDAGYDLTVPDAVWESVERTVGTERVKAIHVNDSQNVCGSHRDRHARLGEGRIGEETLMRFLKPAVKRNLPMILETPNELPGYAEEIRRMRRALEKETMV